MRLFWKKRPVSNADDIKTARISIAYAESEIAQIENDLARIALPASMPKRTARTDKPLHTQR